MSSKSPPKLDIGDGQTFTGVPAEESPLTGLDNLADESHFLGSGFNDEELLEDHDRAETLLIEKANKIESLDYEIYENAVYKHVQQTRTPRERLIYGAMRWIFALIIGCMTGLFAFLINMAVENIAGTKFEITLIVTKSSKMAALLIYALYDVGLVVIACVITTYYAPAATGSGIPDVKIYLNGIDIPGTLLFKTLVGKVFGSICSVAAGLAVGKEGPLVHVGSCTASLVGEGGTGKHKLSWDWYKMFRNDRDRRDLITMGGAAGVAAAFKAPCGGVLFVLEESASWMRPALLWRTFLTTATCHICLRFLRSWCHEGGCGHFGKSEGHGGSSLIIFNVAGTGQYDYSVWEVLPCILLAVIGGCGGALFIKLNTIICIWRRDYQRGKRKVFEAAMVGLLTAVCSYGLPLTFNCRDCPAASALPKHVECPRPLDDWKGNFVNFGCEREDQYNELATLFFNTQDDTIKNLFSMSTTEMFSAGSLLFYGIVFYLLAIVTYGISVPSGLFIPCILCGASYGRLVGMFMVKYYHPSYDIGIEEGTYALLGAASFLGGTMRMTISLCVILIELSNNVAFLPLLMITLLIAKSVGDLFNEGIYDTHVGLKFMPFLEQQPHSLMRHLTAHDIMAKEVVDFGAVERVGYIMEALEKTQHNGFPVMLRNLEYDDNAVHDDDVHEASTFAGCILRSQLLVLLQMRHFMASPEAPQTEEEMVEMYDYANLDFSKVPTSTGLKVEDIKLTADEQDMYLNLLPFVNPNPYLVQQDTSLGKVYTLFRGCALRHLFVIKRVPQIVGMITRKDLLPEFAEERHKTKTMGSAKKLERSSVLRQQKETSGHEVWSPRNSKQKPLQARDTVEVPIDMLSPRGAELRKQREANSPPLSPRRGGSRQNSPDGRRVPLDSLAAMDEVDLAST